MEIQKLNLEYTYKSGFYFRIHNGIRHVKTVPYLSIAQAIEGNYDIRLGNGEFFNTGIGGFFVAPSDIQQTKISKQISCRWVLLKIKLNDLYRIEDLYDFPVIVPDSIKSEMNSVFDRLFTAKNIFDEYVCYYEIVRLLFLISKKRELKTPVYLESALNYIKDNYKSKITVNSLAQTVNLSESHFFSVFKKAMGTSPIAYLNNYRLSIAVEEMLKTDKTITEISNLVGIYDSIYFNKLFKKAYQMSPSQYRKIYKQSVNKLKTI